MNAMRTAVTTRLVPCRPGAGTERNEAISTNAVVTAASNRIRMYPARSRLRALSSSAMPVELAAFESTPQRYGAICGQSLARRWNQRPPHVHPRVDMRPPGVYGEAPRMFHHRADDDKRPRPAGWTTRITRPEE